MYVYLYGDDMAIAHEIVYPHLEIDPSRFGVSIPGLVCSRWSLSIRAVSLLSISSRGQVVSIKTPILRGM
jgi:hypothetical protein